MPRKPSPVGAHNGPLAAGGVPPLALDDEFAPLYTVGQVAGMLGVQAAFLRRLDAEEVVQPGRSEGGQRRYSRVEIMQVQRVSMMASEGLTLAGIRRILELESRVTQLQADLEAERTRNMQRQ